MAGATVNLQVHGRVSTSADCLSRGPTPLITRSPVRSLYVHVPFCFHKCHYCDFYSFVDAQDRQAPFVERLIEELQRLAEHARMWERDGRARLETVFVGGGTPSLLRIELWERLLRRVHELFEIDRGTEFTVECNPETVTRELMEVLRAGESIE